MEDIEYWLLAEELTIVQAALLMAGEDPSSLASEVERQADNMRPPRYEAAKHAIKNALLKDHIQGELIPATEYDRNDNPIGSIRGSVDIHLSLVNVESLRGWLKERGFRSGFFFPASMSEPDYLDPKNDRYAPKLAAAVGAWLATANPRTLQGRHPKQALMKWLRENAAAFGFTDDEGKPSENTLDEIAKIANWKPTGGAPKTPGQE